VSLGTLKIERVPRLSDL